MAIGDLSTKNKLQYQAWFKHWNDLLQDKASEHYKDKDAKNFRKEVDRQLKEHEKSCPNGSIKEIKRDKEALNKIRNSKKSMWFASSVDKDKNMRDIRKYIDMLQEGFYGTSIDPVKEPERYEKHRKKMLTAVRMMQRACNRYLDDHSGIRWTPTGRARRKMVEQALDAAFNIDDLLQLTAQEAKNAIEGPKNIPIQQPNYVQQIKQQPLPQAPVNPVQQQVNPQNPQNPVQQQVNPQNPQGPQQINPQQVPQQNVNPQPQPAPKQPGDIHMRDIIKLKFNVLKDSPELKSTLKLDLINMEKTNPDLLKDIQAGINKTEEPFKGILASINRSQGSSSDIAFREEVGFQLFGGKSSGLSMYEKSVVDLQNNLEKYEKDHPEKFTDPNSLESRVKDFLNGIPDPDLDKLPKDALPEDMQHLYPEVPKEEPVQQNVNPQPQPAPKQKALTPVFLPEGKHMQDYIKINFNDLIESPEAMAAVRMDIRSLEKNNPELYKQISANADRNTEFGSFLFDLSRSANSLGLSTLFRPGVKKQGTVYEEHMQSLKDQLAEIEKKTPDKFKDPNSLESKVKKYLNDLPKPELDKLPLEAIPENLRKNLPPQPKYPIAPNERYFKDAQFELGGKSGEIGTKVNDLANRPLFEHEPCAEDVLQSDPHACFFLAPLRSIVKNDPQRIKDMIRDNGDGTVTVKFNPFEGNDQTNKNNSKQEMLVRIDKTLPGLDNGSATWVRLMEKAMMASRLVTSRGFTPDEDTFKETIKLDSIDGGEPFISTTVMDPVYSGTDAERVHSQNMLQSFNKEADATAALENLVSDSLNKGHVMSLCNKGHVITVNGASKNEAGETVLNCYDQESRQNIDVKLNSLLKDSKYDRILMYDLAGKSQKHDVHYCSLSEIRANIAENAKNPDYKLPDETKKWAKDLENSVQLQANPQNVNPQPQPNPAPQQVNPQNVNPQPQPQPVPQQINLQQQVKQQQNPAPQQVNPQPKPKYQPFFPSFFQQNVEFKNVERPVYTPRVEPFSLKLIELPKTHPEFVQEMLNSKYTDDPQVSDLYKEIMSLTHMNKDRFYKANSVTLVNPYDEKANIIYKKMNDLIRKHPEGLDDPDSPVFKIANLKTQMFSEGTLTHKGDKDVITIDATGKKPESEMSFDGDKDMLLGETIRDRGGLEKYKLAMKNCADEPLFPHDPNPADIRQGNVGDCYFLAFLSSQIKNNPNGIKDMIRDNEDGTCTCRFYNDAGEEVRVTVNKTIPVSFKDGMDVQKGTPSNQEQVPLWVNMIEKAYMMSGLKPLGKEEDSEYKEMISHYKKTHNMEQEMPDEAVKREIFAKRYGNAAVYDEKKFERLIQHTNVGITGGHSAYLNRHINANITYTGVLNKYGHASVCSGLSHGKIQNFKISDMDQKELDPNDRSLLKLIQEKAAYKLFKSKNVEYKINGGGGYKAFKTVTVEDIADAFKAVVNDKQAMADIKAEYEKNTKQPLPNGKIQQLSDEYVKSVEEFQLNNDGSQNTIPFRKEGKYSVFTNNLFNKLEQDVNNKTMCQVSIGSHAYSLLGTRRGKDGKNYVTLCNPWGKHGMLSEKKGGIKIKDLGDGKEKDGMFEMEMNEFTSKVGVIHYDTNKKVMTKDVVSELLAKQYIETFANKYPSKAPEFFKNKCLTSPEIVDKVKQSNEIKRLTEKYMNDPKMMYELETRQNIPQETFEADANLNKNKLENVKNKVVFERTVEQNSKLFSRIARGYEEVKDMASENKQPTSTQQQLQRGLGLS